MNTIATTASVLVPVDGTILAEQALPTAASLVRRLHGRLELVLIRHPRQRYGLEDWPWTMPTPDFRDQYLADKARVWSEALGASVGAACAEGEVPHAICQHAQDVGADLIVMATHARTGFARLLSGSVADSVVRHSRVPVLMLRPTNNPRRARRTPLHIQRILIPLDGTDTARQAFDAIDLVADHGVTELVLLNVVSPLRRRVGASHRIDAYATERLTTAAERELSITAAGLERRTNCDVFPHVIVDDDPARGILRFSRRFNPSLIAMTTYGRGASRLFLGSVADRLLREGTTPMLMVRPSD